MMTNYMVSAIALGACVIGGVSTVVLADDRGGNGFQLRLEGFQENPSLSTPAHGRLTLKIQDNDTIEYHLQYSGFEGTTVTASHIHLGARHTNGGVVAFLCGGGDTPACPVTVRRSRGDDPTSPMRWGRQPGYRARRVRRIRARDSRRVHVPRNVHSARFPGGEIRGQIGDRGDDD